MPYITDSAENFAMKSQGRIMKEKEYNNILLCNKWPTTSGMAWVKYSDHWHPNYISSGLTGSHLHS